MNAVEPVAAPHESGIIMKLRLKQQGATQGVNLGDRLVCFVQDENRRGDGDDGKHDKM